MRNGSRDRRVIRFIAEHIKETGWPPSIREIQEKFGFKSTSTVTYYVNRLIEGGYVEREPGIARGLKITEAGKLYSGV